MTYDVGERVEYKPPGGLIGVFTIIRRMPNEPRAYVLDKERIGILREDVLESALTKLTPSPMALPTLWDKSGPTSRAFRKSVRLYRGLLWAA